MYRAGPVQDNAAVGGPPTMTAARQNPRLTGLPSDDLEEYTQTMNAHMPTMSLLRCIGLVPACFRKPVALQVGSEHAVNGLCHRIGHFILWIYAFLVWSLLLVAGVWALVFLIAAPKSTIDETNRYWMLFDLFSLCQTILVVAVFVLKGSTFGWLLSSFDFFILSFTGVYFNRADLPVEAMLLQEKQGAGQGGPNDTDLAGKTKSRVGSGKPYPAVNQVEPILSIQQRNEDESRISSRNHNSVEEMEFSEVYIRKSRMWDFLVMTLWLTLVLCVTSYVIYARVETYVLKDKLPPLVYPYMLQWSMKEMSINADPWILTTAGVILDSLVQILQMMPSMFFITIVHSFLSLTNEYNERVRLARDDGFLDIDATITYHHRLKTLAKRLSKSFGLIVFLIIFGDMLIIASASFLGLVKKCRWLDGDGLCVSYLARHLLLVIRLITVLLVGASIKTKLDLSINEMDGYMCKSILNTERLKILGMIYQCEGCSFSAHGFFSLSKPFVMGVLTLAVVYIAIMINQG